MGSSGFNCYSAIFLVLLLLNATHYFSFVQTRTLCRVDERSALFQFKESFVINKSVSWEPYAYPKVASWAREGDQSRSDCCSWDGVECDEESGHVIGLDLSSSCLYGSINSNSSLFQLVHLQRLDLSDNHFNFSQIPSKLGHYLTLLTYLNLSMSSFSGQIPSEISKLSKLSTLDLSFNQKLTTTNLRSLVQNMTNIKQLHLSQVKIYSTVPNILANASSLTSLKLGNCGLYGEFPVGIFHLPRLEVLYVYTNSDLAGYFPNFNQSNAFKKLNVGDTNFSGQLPTSIGNLHSLNLLIISNCNFYSRLSSSLGNLSHLSYLDMSSFYDVSTGQLVSDSWSWVGKLANLYWLDLESTNVRGKFPSFAANLTKLESLNLSTNKISGHIPSWLMKLSRLTALNLGSNFLTGFDQDQVILPWQNLSSLDLESNMLQGSLPFPPQSIRHCVAGNNRYTGEISPKFCNLNDLIVLDLYNNNLSGTVPHCLGNSSVFEVLILQNNSFQGDIPPICTNKSSLKIVDLSYNQLRGKLPRSVANCTRLEFLNLGNNQLSDIFPSWLGALPVLRALNLRSNGFHGMIGKPATNHEFPKLCIIDLSNNRFSGMLPYNYLENWNSMKFVDENNQTYFEVYSKVGGSYELGIYIRYSYSMTIYGKGVELKYEKTPYLLRLIDLSSNRFDGQIPAGIIGNLRGLLLLNLSNNTLTGHIPSSLGKLTVLESLDLSQNQLSGRIPGNLRQLTFLEYFNVSHNHLWGAIPLGQQFDTFLEDSYQGNSGLCGKPLSKKCEESDSSAPPPPPILEEEDVGIQIELDWYVVLPGVVSGLIVGVVSGNTLANNKHEWFVEKFSRRTQTSGTRRRRARRN